MWKSKGIQKWQNLRNLLFFCVKCLQLKTSILKKICFFQTWIFLKSRPLPFRKTCCEYKANLYCSGMSFKGSVKCAQELQLPRPRGFSNDARLVHFLVRPFELLVCYLFQNREGMKNVEWMNKLSPSSCMKWIHKIFCSLCSIVWILCLCFKVN